MHEKILKIGIMYCYYYVGKECSVRDVENLIGIHIV